MLNRRPGLLSLLVLCVAPACSMPTRGAAPLAQARQVVMGPPAVAGVDGPLAMTTLDTPAPVWQGAPPEARLTGDVAIEAADTPPSRSSWRERPRAKKIRPDRESLPQNPFSAELARPGMPLLSDRGGLPNLAQTAATPNVDVATLNDTQSLPPDTMGDVGPTQYLVGLNGRVRTISKATGAKDNVLDADFDVFFTNTIRGGNFTSDPRVRYDRRTGRWFILMITVAVPNRFVLAVSNSSTITAGTVWTQFQWTNTRTQGGAGGGASCLADYPTLGIDEDALYVGVNQFCGSNLNALGFDSTSAYVINKASLVAGTLTVAQFDGLVPNGVPGTAGIYTPQGVDNLDSGTNEGYFVGVDNAQFGSLVIRRVSSPSSAPSLSADINVTVPATQFPEDVPHAGGILLLDGLDDRLLQAVIRAGRLWTGHQIAVDASGNAVASGGRTGVRWYEIGNLGPSPSTPTLVQSGTIFDPASSNPAFYWMGSIMTNGQRHVAVGMSKAGTGQRVNTAFSGRLASDTSGAMDTPTQYSSNTTFAYNQQTAPDLSQRWGDYSYTSVDPEDDQTFWTLQQYVNGTNSYAVRLVKLLAPGPATPVVVTPNTIQPGQSSVVVTVSGNTAGGRGFFDPGTGFSRRLAASFSGTGVVVTNVVVNNPSTLTLTLNTTAAGVGVRTLTVTNPDGQTASLSSAITIGQPGANQAPVFVGAPADKTIFDNGEGGTTGSLAFLVTDPDGQPLTLTATSSNTTVIPQNRITTTLTGANATISVSSVGRLGTSRITLTASDGALSATSSFDVTVAQSAVAGAPQNFAAVVSRNRITFTWDPPSSTTNEPVLAYRLEGGTSPGGTVGTLPLGSGTTYTLFNAPSGTFYLRVRAQTAAGLGPPSNEVFVGTGQAAPPLAPKFLLATVQGTGLALQWTENPLGPVIVGYQIHAGSAPGLSDIGILPLPATARTFAASAPPGTYYIRVHAVNAAGVSVASNEAVIVAGPTTCTVPLTPLNFAATSTSRRLTLTWNAPEAGAIPTGYVVRAGTTSGASSWGTVTIPATATTTSISALVPSGPYFLSIAAANACGESGVAPEVSLTIP